jgi:glutamate/tyrosine decarboxylase-like PLP-dependent enzyme
MPTTIADTRALLLRAADIATAFLQRSDDPAQRVTRSPTPEEIRSHIPLAIPTTGRNPHDVLDDLQRVLDLSVLTGHPGFCNQLFGGYDPIAIIAEWAVAVLNTSMYTYEVAPALTLIENETIERMCRLAGFETPALGEGTFTPGGSLSNLVAVMLARHHARPAAKDRGLLDGPQLVLFTSEEAHYSLQRAAIILGLGADACRTVTLDRHGRMDVDALEHAITTSKSRGEQPFMVSATAGTTVLGVYDLLQPIAEIARRHNLWMHVDGAYGGSALLSPSHREKLAGVELADSLTWCPHKMMNVPLICSVILTRHQGLLAACNALNAEYLFHQTDEDSCLDLGHMSIQCGRRVDALKLWLAWQARGDDGFASLIDAKFEQARALRRLIRARENFVLLHDPDAIGGGANTCFHYLPPRLRNMPDTPDRARELQLVTHALRDRMKRAGRYLVNYAPVFGVSAFRHVASHTAVTDADLSAMLDEMERLGHDL